MLGDRIQVNHTWCEHDGEIRLREPPRQLAEAADAAALARASQERELELLLGDSPRRTQGQPVARRCDHQVGLTRAVQLRDEAIGIRNRFLGGPGEIDRKPPFDQAADIETHRARIDADDARHNAYFFAISSRATSAIVSASSTRSLRVKSRATQALCSLVLKLPTPKAP